ncbi:MAG: hypothetical protein Q8L48_03400 [Archangium sp.]|nr:hypothetical protein [Archangium sp.]
MVASRSSQVPVVSDVVLSIAEALLGRRLLGDPRSLAATRPGAIIDRAMMPPSTTGGFELKDGEVTARVRLDESWWNEHTLAQSNLFASLELGQGRGLSLWLEEEGLRWRVTGLSAAEVEAVTRIVGSPPVP